MHTQLSSVLVPLTSIPTLQAAASQNVAAGKTPDTQGGAKK